MTEDRFIHRMAQFMDDLLHSRDMHTGRYFKEHVTECQKIKSKEYAAIQRRKDLTIGELVASAVMAEHNRSYDPLLRDFEMLQGIERYPANHLPVLYHIYQQVLR